jgi:asparagine synthase (glutamine-hydrolysing)
MCGIVGVLNWRGAPPDPELTRRMTQAIVHRGPDDEGHFRDGAVALGFRRLSIIDLAGGHQPMSTDDGRYTIVFNGEIYNYRELRTRLESERAVRFRTTSDTEVILYAVREWGESAIELLNGMFAFALWDGKERRLLLARDRLGKKPLFYTATDRGFCFASEVKALLQHPGVVAEVDRARIPSFLAYRYVPGEETLFRHVHCLPPASTLLVDGTSGPGSTRRYWDFSYHDGRAPADEATSERELEDLLADSVSRRMVADVPVGAFLSGGVDSSLIVALMSERHPEPVKTFSIGFDAGVDESSYARKVARHFATDHHEVRVGSRELMQPIAQVLAARETPITEASDIPIYLLSRLARTKVTVALSGEGSDEVFAGYPKYAFVHRFGKALGLVPRPLLRGLAAVLPFGLRRAQLALLCAAQGHRLERHSLWFGGFPPNDREALVEPGLLAEGPAHEVSEEMLAGHRFPSAVEEMLYLDTRHWLPANLLLRGDRMTMAHSLELRCPFLDYRLVEFGARLPLGLKLRGGAGKWLVRRIAAKRLPPEIVARRKWGFKVPLDEWFRGPLQGLLRETLLAPRALARGYFREAGLRALIDAHVSGRINYEKQLWILFQLELWHLMFVDQTLSATDAMV